MKVFNTGIIVGRFQHIHNGHEKIINIGRSLCDKLLVFIDSYGEVPSFRNPYDYEYRKKLIEMIYKEDISSGSIIIKPLKNLDNKNDLSPKWGEYVLENVRSILGKNPECIIYGKDKDIFKCFDKNTVKNITEVLVDRNCFNISATKMRDFLVNDNSDKWRKYANEAIYDEYDNLRKKLLICVNNNHPNYEKSGDLEFILLFLK